MSIGNLETLVRDLLLLDDDIMDEFSSHNILLAEPASGVTQTLPYMVLHHEGQNYGSFEATMVKGFLEIDVLYTQKNYDKINIVLNRLRTLLHGTRLISTGYFAECSFFRSSKINITEIRKNVLGKTIRFEVHEAF